MLCFDSDLLIGFLKNEVAATKFLEKNPGIISIIAAHEVFFGAKTKKEQSIAEAFLREFNVQPYNWREMAATVKIQQRLLRRGKPIGKGDELIAGTCIANNFTLVTRNKKHFSRIKGLKVKKW
ncbi:MAG: type II toxin-antitoxin system VapC family toxin [Candidatus Woesearchaeota archaeon]|nr:type II toxin-antitoxin system VapC family toxin [Candidatus Woesearchaeota archaeon]